MDYKRCTDGAGKPYLEVELSDYGLLAAPLLNKGMAFPYQERLDFGLLGLLPPREASLEEQQARSYEAFSSKTSDLEKYLYLRDLQDSNEILFYSLINAHITEMTPIIYTPTVGLGCQRFSHIYRRPRGVFLAYPDRDRIDHMLSNPRFDAVEVIVVSDGERILGLGDQGAGGMGIPIGKLALYSACAGIYPGHTLPILLDTGTHNPDLLQDPLYIGWQHERIRGAAYEAFIDTFVTAVKKRFPHVLLQWEDFAQQNASPILERYRDQLCTFNDDIQGTAAVATGALLAAIQKSGVPLKDQRIAIFGAGSAGCGISELLVQTMMGDGLPETEARARFFLVDRNGLLVDSMAGLLPFQQKLVQSKNTVATWRLGNPNHINLQDVISNARPTLLIGVSGQGGAFSKNLVEEMAKQVERPIIFPLSNPTDRTEAAPADLMQWTNNRAIIGTGSPFPDIAINGKSHRVDQVNNSYIFPGVGLGLVAAKAKRVTDKMFIAAAKALAACSPAKSDTTANLLPPLTDVRKVAYQVALAVANEAINSGLAGVTEKVNLEQLIHDRMWTPAYLPYKKMQNVKS